MYQKIQVIALSIFIFEFVCFGDPLQSFEKIVGICEETIYSKIQEESGILWNTRLLRMTTKSNDKDDCK